MASAGGDKRTASHDAPRFVPVQFGPDDFVVFPFAGKSIVLERPGVTRLFYPAGSSADGKVIFGRSSSFRNWEGLLRIDFAAGGIGVVPGSEGLGDIYSFIESQPPGRIYVSGRVNREGKIQCGDFEIDLAAGVLRPLRIGTYPDCGGPISPDGKRELSVTDGRLILRDLVTGSEQVLGKGFQGPPRWIPGPAWSPNGRWISALAGEGGSVSSVVLIDANDPSKRRKLGETTGRPLWSPDSKWLLFPKAQLLCAAALYSVSLEAVNIDEGSKILPPSARCRILFPLVWVAQDLPKWVAQPGATPAERLR
jgi:hypothetical protein